jgi:hypothetical protein
VSETDTIDGVGLAEEAVRQIVRDELERARKHDRAVGKGAIIP